MEGQHSVAHWLAEIVARQEYLRTLLAADDPSWAERPPSGKWSIVENLQHLIFAEQSHFRRHVDGRPAWSAYALPPTSMQAQKQLGGLGRPAAGVREVLDEWARVHESTKTLPTEGSPQLLNRLERHVNHLNAHVTVIERLLRSQRRGQGT